MKRIAIIGTWGIPAQYGGYETLAENLVKYHHENKIDANITVFCSSSLYADKKKKFLAADLFYIPLRSQGASSVVYDILSMVLAISKGCDVLLCLGYSGASFFPIVRLLSSARIITNIDGIEKNRGKFSTAVKLFLALNEYLAVKFSHKIIADNMGIVSYLKVCYRNDAIFIPYGGDHAVEVNSVKNPTIDLPKSFFLGLCRIEPENNIEMILSAFQALPEHNLVFIGNWRSSAFGIGLYDRFHAFSNILLLDPIYDLGVLKAVRESCSCYVHGHSVGGTNPSLVEMMHFEKPIFAYDCTFNRFTTCGVAQFFSNETELIQLVLALNQADADLMGNRLKAVAENTYTWKNVGKLYFEVLL